MALHLACATLIPRGQNPGAPPTPVLPPFRPIRVFRSPFFKYRRGRAEPAKPREMTTGIYARRANFLCQLYENMGGCNERSLDRER